MLSQHQSRTLLTQSFTPVGTHVLQRKCARCQHMLADGECDQCRRNREPGMLRRKALSWEADTRGSALCTRSGGLVPPIIHEVLGSPGQPLDQATRAFMEPRFGHDFSQVRVHTNEKAAESARAVNALAYTVGRNVAFGSGQYAPGTVSGAKLLAHELTHVAQQAATARAVSQPARVISNAADAAEVEADFAARQIM